MKKDKILISICSRNFDKKLLNLLNCLKKNVNYSNLNIKIIIVINKKKKLTFLEKKLIKEQLKKIYFKILYEKKIGISNARNKVLNYIKKLNYDYGCFLDDDCIVESNFLESHLNFIKKNSCDIVGGPQLYKSKHSFFRALELNKKDNSTVRWVSTNNVFFSKNAIPKKINFSNVVTKYGFGEDQLFFSKLSILGKNIKWHHNPVFEIVQKEREYLMWFLLRNFRYGLTGILIDRELYGNFYAYLLNILKALFNLLKSILFAILIPLEVKINFFKSLGFFSKFIGRLFSIFKI